MPSPQRHVQDPLRCAGRRTRTPPVMSDDLTDSSPPSTMRSRPPTSDPGTRSANPQRPSRVGLDDYGVPIAVQFAGRVDDEITLLRFAAELERARPWATLRPTSGERVGAVKDPEACGHDRSADRQPMISASREDDPMSTQPPRFVRAAIARLMGDDPLAPKLLAAAADEHPDSFEAAAALALVATNPAQHLQRALDMAHSRRERQHVGVIAVWQAGDHDRATILAREHLAEFPDELVISWLVGQA